jgi:hypothetical protein
LYADGAFCVHGVPEPGAVLDMKYANRWRGWLSLALSTLVEDPECWAMSVDGTSAAHVRLCAGRPGPWCVLTFVRDAKVSGRIAS